MSWLSYKGPHGLCTFTVHSHDFWEMFSVKASTDTGFKNTKQTTGSLGNKELRSFKLLVTTDGDMVLILCVFLERCINVYNVHCWLLTLNAGPAASWFMSQTNIHIFFIRNYNRKILVVVMAMCIKKCWDCQPEIKNINFVALNRPWCYSLVLQCPREAHMLKAWPRAWLWGGRLFRLHWISGSNQTSWGCACQMTQSWHQRCSEDSF